MNRFLKVDLRRLSPHRPPVMLLGGINLVRALGLADIPVIVASAQRFTPAMASRYCTGRCMLPPPAQREAVLERLLRVGEILTGELCTRLPLVYNGGVRQRGLSLHRFVAQTATKPAKLFGLFPHKGTIAVGSITAETARRARTGRAG